MVTQINKQTFYPNLVGAVLRRIDPRNATRAFRVDSCDVHSNRTGVECLINSNIYHK